MIREKYTKQECFLVADALARKTLPHANDIADRVQPSTNLYVRYGKRLLDIMLSFCAIVVTAPINLIIMIATFIDVGRPLIFKQVRIGKNCQEFTLVKFRNMRNAEDENGEPLPAAQRVTRFGRLVRKTSLDELLNFWSVLKGDMSIIGPRPLLPEYTNRYTDRHKMRLAVRPGLECPPRSLNSGQLTWNDQFENDIWYVENLCFRTDLKMAANLVRYALSSRHATLRGEGKRTAFLGYNEQGEAISVSDVPEEFAAEALRKANEN